MPKTDNTNNIMLHWQPPRQTMPLIPGVCRRGRAGHESARLGGTGIGASRAALDISTQVSTVRIEVWIQHWTHSRLSHWFTGYRGPLVTGGWGWCEAGCVAPLVVLTPSHLTLLTCAAEAWPRLPRRTEAGGCRARTADTQCTFRYYD